MKKIFTLLITFALILILVTPQTTEAATMKLNKTSITISQGEYYNLKLIGAKSNVTWYTNNKKKATVTSSGKVYGVKYGNAIITARVGKTEYNCKVLVAYPTIEKHAKTLRYGKTMQLKITYLPKNIDINDIKWRTTNPNVVSVDKNGNLKALSPGYSSIVVSVGDRQIYSSITVPDLNEDEQKSIEKPLLDKLNIEYGSFNGHNIIIFSSEIPCNIDYTVEFYDGNDLISVSNPCSAKVLKGKEIINYLPTSDKSYTSYKLRYNSITENTTSDIPNPDIDISTTELYDYTYQYSKIKDTIKLFDLKVVNNTKNRIAFNANVVFYKDNKIVNVRNYDTKDGLDIGMNTIKYSALEYAGYYKIYNPDYDNYRIIY